MAFFDNSGRYCVQTVARSLVAAHKHLDQPEVVTDSDYEYLLSRLQAFFRPLLSRNPHMSLTVHDIKRRSSSLLERVRRDVGVSNLLKGVHVPLVLPPLVGNWYRNFWARLRGQSTTDYGILMQKVFLPALERSCRNMYWHRPVVDRVRNILPQQVEIVPGSRHERLLSQMRRGPTVAMFFPLAFNGISAQQARQLIQVLPGDFLLSGGVDVATAFVLYPELFASDARTPALGMPAIEIASSRHTLLAVKTWTGVLTRRGLDRRGVTAVSGSNSVHIAEPDCSMGILLIDSENH